MCEICAENASKADHFECSETTDWPNHPWTQEKRIQETHEFARYKHEDPDGSFPSFNPHEGCSHENHHVMVQDWQGVNILVKVCNTCGMTIKATEDF